VVDFGHPSSTGSGGGCLSNLSGIRIFHKNSYPELKILFRALDGRQELSYLFHKRNSHLERSFL
jgi:hypothetical protein